MTKAISEALGWNQPSLREIGASYGYSLSVESVSEAELGQTFRIPVWTGSKKGWMRITPLTATPGISPRKENDENNGIVMTLHQVRSEEGFISETTQNISD